MDASRLAEIERIYSYHSSTAARHVGELLAYIAALQADLQACAEALATVNPWCFATHRHNTCDLVKVSSARSRPGVQAILKGGDAADGEEEVR